MTSDRLSVSADQLKAIRGHTIWNVFNESSNDDTSGIGNSPDTRVDRKRLAQLVRLEDSDDQSETSGNQSSACNTRDGSNDEERVSVGEEGDDQ